MKEDWLALRNITGVATVFGVVMLLLWTLISQGITTFLVPSPEMAAEEFLQALGSHDYQAAHDQLSEVLQQQIKEQDLQALTESLEAAQRGIEDAHGQESQEQDTNAQATASVKLSNQQERTLEFSLTQEHGEWKLTSVEPVRLLAGG